MPSTSQRMISSSRWVTAVTVPQRSVSAISAPVAASTIASVTSTMRVEIGDGDPLVGRVDVSHPVRKVDAGRPALVEDVRVGAAAGERGRGLVAGPPQALGCEANGRLVAR